MEALSVQWSKSKQQELESQLIGYWAEDKWAIGSCPIQDGCKSYSPNKSVYFVCNSRSLNAELKYACWQKLVQKEWSTKTLWAKVTSIKEIALWLNATTPSSVSFVERSLTTWETLFRSYLVNIGRWKTYTMTQLDKDQKVREYINQGDQINTLRQVYKIIQDAYDDRSEYDKEIWDIRKLGIPTDPSKSIYKINFSKISQPWLLKAAKHFLKYELSIHSVSQCQNKLAALNDFSVFLSYYHPLLIPSEITRPLILEYLSQLPLTGLTNGTRYGQISNLKIFLELCTREGWADVPERRLIYNEDFPKLGASLPRFIPEDVLSQLNQHLDKLPLQIMRMVIILQECGMRISELCRLSFNCLIQDAQGDWFLLYYQFKMKKEHTIPISVEVATVIREQQQMKRDEQGENFPYLFFTPKSASKSKPIRQDIFTDALNQLAHEQNIRDNNGSLWHFQSHQFRHTVGTRMINMGVPQHIIQRYLGHETPEMTARYAYIYDQTLKEEFVKFKDKMVDVTGANVSIDTVVKEMASGCDPNSIDEQWMKKNILAQALPNGLCGLPVVQKACPYGANRCLTGADGKGCPHFKTDVRYLDQHKDHLERTTKIVEWAQENQGSRRSQEILKENLPVFENLKRIVNSLEGSQDASEEC